METDLIRIQDFLESNKNPTKAEQEKKYLKSPFKFYGVPNPELKRIAKQFYKENKEITTDKLWNFVFTLWESDWHEKRTIAIKVLMEFNKSLNISDLSNIERMLRTSVNWDLIDELSVHILGSVLIKDFEKVKDFLISWSKDQNFWMRRASMLCHILVFRKEREDELYQSSKSLFFSFAEDNLNEDKPEEYFTTDIMPKKMGLFFIRKCIGWVLREMSKHSPDDVIKFVEDNKDRMSGLTHREAIRKISKT